MARHALLAMALRELAMSEGPLSGDTEAAEDQTEDRPWEALETPKVRAAVPLQTDVIVTMLRGYGG